MKKYVKPDLFFEKFELSRQIAACHYDLNLAENACKTFKDPYGDIFINKADCQGYLILEENEEYCYYPPVGFVLATFNS